MKKFMMAGGLLGFGIGMVFGYVQQTDWPSVLWRASVATVCGGLLLRWWARVGLNSLKEALQHKAAEHARLSQVPESTSAKS